MSTINNIIKLMFIYETRNKPLHRTGRGLVFLHASQHMQGFSFYIDKSKT